MDSKLSHVKVLGQVAAVILSDIAPTVTYVLWYDTEEDTLKIFDKAVGDWIPLSQQFVDGKNVGTGKGAVYKGRDLIDAKLTFRTLQAGSGINITTEDNVVVVKLESYLNILNRTVILGNQEGSIGVLQIDSNIDWGITFPNGKPSWVSFLKEEGSKSDSVVITAIEENVSENAREFSCLIRDKAKELDGIELFVVQESNVQDSSIVVFPETFEFEAKGGSQTFSVLITGSIKSFRVLSVSNSTFSANKISESALLVTVGINDNVNPRNATITLIHGDNVTTKEVQVTQAGYTTYEVVLKSLSINGVEDVICQVE